MDMKSWLRPLLAGMLAISLTACSGGEGAGTTADVKAPPAGLKDDTTPVTIQYWHAHAEAQLKGLNAQIAAFQKKYPHITVEAVYQGGYGDLHKKLQAPVAANDVPDVTNIWRSLRFRTSPRAACSPI
ncbi:hypothetical protein J6TS7_54190 [Paenibacillus dendritiformis]|uniref:extracellular solute-binding protein n=1 Tax=Paenibacillus TaxID=44249 RepID=UPI001B199AC6|nr:MULTISPECIES: extracellular solute-binding protein [Paenibacillus]MEB9897591.1 extracellular solute-binding protein [Bacillus cereus]GIO81809.1 hypothetical protein J6TS7_54190 [Paenibacillus dendritiformis]